MSAVKMGLTIEEAAECTGIGRNTMRKLVDWGKLPVLRVGRSDVSWACSPKIHRLKRTAWAAGTHLRNTSGRKWYSLSKQRIVISQYSLTGVPPL